MYTVIKSAFITVFVNPEHDVEFFGHNNYLAAAQMWCLGRFLPLLIGNLVPQEDERWKLFNMLLEISDIVFSPIVSEDSIGVLEGLIEEHHATFLTLYPGRSVIPKMHYMVHYPAHMLRLAMMKLCIY